MTKVVRVDEVHELKRSKVLFDTNIWIMIEGFNEGAPERKVSAYSNAYEKLLHNNNTILYNEHIINEFCNTCARIDFSAYLLRLGGNKRISFKEYRRTGEFKEAMRLVREACLDIIDSCAYAPVDSAEFDMRGLADEICQGELDFTDIVIRNFCRSNDVYLLTDDADFRNSGVKIISANRRFMNPIAREQLPSSMKT